MIRAVPAKTSRQEVRAEPRLKSVAAPPPPAIPDVERRHLVFEALRSPRGRYGAERAAQLSGIPKSTVYDWQRDRIYVPDFARASPMAWSYRDLVYLRLLAWLRQNHLGRDLAAAYVRECRASHAPGAEPIETVRTDGRTVLVDGEVAPRIGWDQPFPLPEITDLMSKFSLLDPVGELGERPLWGPDLITPSPYTFMSPWVMAGEPCVDNSRVPTATIHALRAERGLDERKIVALYPGLSAASVEDAWSLEGRLRRAA